MQRKKTLDLNKIAEENPTVATLVAELDGAGASADGSQPIQESQTARARRTFVATGKQML